jgi:hypothetical protein
MGASQYADVPSATDASTLLTPFLFFIVKGDISHNDHSYMEMHDIPGSLDDRNHIDFASAVAGPGSPCAIAR